MAIRKRPRVIVVFGTRPEAIKLAPVVHELRRRKEVETVVCVTGQHRQMLDQVLTVFQITPDVDLNLMQPNQDLTSLTASTLVALREVFAERSPAYVVVQGDTTTTFAASLAAFYQRVPVAHVEAGLRTGNMLSPWPEEMNRVVTTRLTSIHFPPTKTSKENLRREGIPAKRIHVTGNTVVDALLQISGHLDRDPALERKAAAQFSFLSDDKELLLVTGHRRESFGGGLDSICHALVDITSRNKHVEVVYPVHLNPNVRDAAGRILRGVERIHMIEPVDYLPLVYLLRRCRFVLTDSGGIQEEAPALGKPVLVLRNNTERPEGISAGTARLVGTDRRKILGEAERLLSDARHYKKMSRAHNPYGDGNASKRIADVLVRELTPRS
jgi:UDP-N-acetylglucosamine 2-epimerase (non-hydrolysing)